MRIDSTKPMRILLAAALCASCWGCGVAGGGVSTDLIPVKGKVIYKGKPLTKGRVKFAPDGYGRPAYGPIQGDGTFVLTTDKEGDGVIAGSHRVTVSETGIKSPRDTLAAKWSSAAASGLTAEVAPEHTEFNFELK